MKKRPPIFNSLIASFFMLVFAGVYGLDFVYTAKLLYAKGGHSHSHRPHSHPGSNHHHNGPTDSHPHPVASASPDRLPHQENCCKEQTTAFFSLAPQ
jgi:hypothetical protein